MKFFVVEGKPLAFTLTSSAASDTQVTFKAKGVTIGVLTVAAASFAAAGQDPKTRKAIFTARYSWTAPLLSGEITELAVTMEHDKQARGAKPTDIVVYCDKLTIQTIAPGGATPAVNVAGVRCRLMVEVDAEWQSYTKRLVPGAFIKDTGADGTATFEGLPYGVVNVQALAPAALEGAWTKTSKKWTGAVVAGYRVELVYPPVLADAAPALKQWVNLDATAAAALNDPLVGTGETYGSKATIKVKLAGGQQVAGRPIWLCAVFGKGNSPRIGNPRPALGTQAATPNTPVVDRAVTNEEGVASFSLELGAAGGDEVALYAAGHGTVGPGNFDVKTRLQNWRRFQIHLVRMKTDDEAKEAALRASNSPSIIDAEVRSHCTAELAKAFIELTWIDDDEPASLSVPAADIEFVTGAAAEIIRLDPERNHTIWVNPQEPNKKLKASISLAHFNPPRMHFFIVDRIFTRETLMQTLTPTLDELRAGVKISPKSGNYFLTKDIDDAKKVVLDWSAGQPSYWQIGTGEKRPLNDASLSIVEGTSNQRALIKVPADQIPASGTIKMCLKVQTYGGSLGDTSGKFLAITSSTKPAAAESVARRRLRLLYVILHELGHALKLAPPNPKERNFEDVERNPDWYVRKVKDGNHCSNGIAPEEKTKPEDAKPWNDALSVLSGGCVLYSPVHGRTPYETVSKYCPTCLRHLKAAQLGLLTTSPGRVSSDFPEVTPMSQP